MRVTAQLRPASYEPRLTPPLRINVRGISLRSAVAGAVVVGGCAAALSAMRRLSIPTLTVHSFPPHSRVSMGCHGASCELEQGTNGGCVGADGRGREGAPAMARCRGRVRKGREGRQAPGGARCASRQKGTAEGGLFPQGQGGGRARLEGKVIASVQAVSNATHHAYLVTPCGRPRPFQIRYSAG